MVPLLMIAAVYAAFKFSQNAAQAAANAPAPVIPLFTDQQPGIIGGTFPNATAGAAKPNNANVPSTAASGVPNSDPRAAMLAAGAVDQLGPSAFAHPYAPVWHLPGDVATQTATQPKSKAVGAPDGLTVLFNSGRRSPASSATGASSGGCSGGCGGCNKRSRCAANGGIGIFQPTAQQMADWAETMRTSGALSGDGLLAAGYLQQQSSDPTPAAAPSYNHF